MRFGQTRPPAVRGVTPGDRRRFVAMGLLLIGLLGGMIYFGSGYWEDRAEKKRQERLPEGELDDAPEAAAPVVPEIPVVAPEVPQPFAENPEIWSRAADRTPVIEEHLLAHAFHRLATLSQEEIEARAGDRRLSAPELMDRPELYRGQFLYLPVRLDAEFSPKVIDPNPSGVQTYYEFFGIDKDRYLWQLLLYDKDREYEPGEAVVVRGIFVKIYKYTDRSGTPRYAPTVVARRFATYEPPPPEFPWLEYVVGAVLLVSGAGFLVVFLRSRRIERQGDSQLRAMRSRRFWRDRPPPAGGEAETREP